MTPDALTLASAIILLISLIALLFLKVVFRRRDSGKGRISDGVVDVADTKVKVRVTVHYGTQTGTAERFAHDVENELKQRYGNTVCVHTSDLEHVTSESAEDVLLEGIEHGGIGTLRIFLQSTYGDGEPTDTSAEFVHWVRNAAEDGRMPDLLEKLTYSVFGLGNSSYEHYNAAAKLIDKSLHALGASPLLKIHLGDDDCTLEDDFLSWREALWVAIESKYEISAEVGIEGRGELSSYTATAASKEVGTSRELEVSSAMTKQPKGGITTQTVPYAALIARARELHSRASDRSCVHIEFDIKGTGIKYQHGDHLGVFAENSSTVVQRAAASLRLPLDHVFTLSIPADAATSLAPPFPTPCSLGTALAKYADLLSPPRKVALTALASVALDPEEKQRLKHLASAAGKQEYAAYIVEPARSLLEILEAFPSAVPPLGLFFGAVSARLAPRYYSISSSPLEKPDVITATVAVVKGNTPTGRLHEGVASTYLSSFVPNHRDLGGGEVSAELKHRRVPIFVRSSTFKLPKDPSVPIVMIGPGTGYAPFRGFIQERAALAKSGALLGPAYLFFGCRHEEQDYIYQEEMEAALSQNNLTYLSLAFSREVSGRKVYVQDNLMLAAKDLYAIMKGTVGANEGRIYVCGDAKGMARDVHRALHRILMTEGGYAGHEAEEIVKRLSDVGRYHKDVW